MKEGWEYKTIGEIATIRRGLTYKKEDEVEKSNKIVLRSNNVDLETHQLDFSELKYLKEDFEIPEDKMLKEGDLLMCMSNGSKIHLGKVALIDHKIDYAFGGFMSAIEHDECVSDKYFYYSLISPTFKKHIKKLQDGANINNLKVRDIEDFTIPVPSLAEQQQIVSFLDSEFEKIDALKANAETQLQAAKDLFQKALKEMLTPKEGWEEKKLNEIALYYNGLTYKPTDVSKHGFLVLRSSNIQNNLLSLKDQVRVSVEVNDKLKIHKGDIIMCSRNGSKALIGKVAIIPEEYDDFTFGTFMMVIKSKYNPLLYYFFLSERFKGQIWKGEANMINQITRYMLDDVLVCLPSNIEEQKKIVDNLDTLSAKVKQLEKNYNETITLCNDLKQSLLKRIFE